MKKEIWKDIEGYEGWYEVSNFGRIRSLDRVIIHSDGRNYPLKGRIMKISKGANGYLICNLHKNSKSKLFTVHRLVAQAFIPNPNNLSDINHKDEDKTNNCVENLEWCTRLYNNCYGTRLKRVAEKKSMPVLQLDKEKDVIISKYPSTREAERLLKISHNAISACCNGKRKTAGGFNWCYKQD